MMNFQRGLHRFSPVIRVDCGGSSESHDYCVVTVIADGQPKYVPGPFVTAGTRFASLVAVNFG